MSKRILRFLAAIVLAFGSLFSFAPAAYAEDNSAEETKPAIWLQISPVSNKVVLVAGEETEYSFTVSNIGSESFGYHVYAAPYTISDEDYNVSFNKETNRTQISRWIQFYKEDGSLANEAHFNIDKGAKQTIRYRIKVPDSIPAGGQYATIFAESDEVEGDITSSGIKTVSRVGLIVYGRTDGDTVDEAKITDFGFKTFMLSGNIVAESRVENNGNTDFEATYDLNIQSIFGKQLYSKTSSYNILPDTARRVATEWEETPLLGLYKVDYKVSALNGQVTEEKSAIVVIMPIFVIVLGIILLTLIIVWIIILVRKRKERKSRLLV